jgi:tRNA pseudouridine55 synthase
VERGLAAFRGTFQQVPPPHSAKKVEGVRAYKRARAARPVELKAAVVTVTRLELLDMTGGEARVHVECSAGFYVRSLAHDLGEALGTHAMLAALTRTRAGAFGRDRAVDLTMLTERPDEALGALFPMDTLLSEIPAIALTDKGAERARHGQELGPTDFTGPPVGSFTILRLVSSAGNLVGVARPGAVTGTLHPSVIVG